MSPSHNPAPSPPPFLSPLPSLPLSLSHTPSLPLSPIPPTPPFPVKDQPRGGAAPASEASTWLWGLFQLYLEESSPELSSVVSRLPAVAAAAYALTQEAAVPGTAGWTAGRETVPNDIGMRGATARRPGMRWGGQTQRHMLGGPRAARPHPRPHTHPGRSSRINSVSVEHDFPKKMQPKPRPDGFDVEQT